MCYDLQYRNRDFVSDLLSLLHSGGSTWKPMATIAVHIDESGTHGSRSPWCIVAGQLGSAADWSQFTDDWNAVRNRPEYDGVVVHTSHIWSRTGDFQNWTTLKGYQFLLHLTRIIEHWRNRIFGFAVAVPVEEYAQIVAPTLPVKLRDPYFMALGSILRGVLEMSDSKFEASMVSCISDQRDDGTKQRARLLYSAIRDGLGQEKNRLNEEILFQSKERVVPLQAADLLANSAFRDLTHGPEGDPASVLIRGELNLRLNRCFVQQPIALDSQALHIIAGSKMLS